MRVDVQKIVGDSALTLEDGQNLYELIKPSLENGEKVCLDFSGISLFASLFFNAAVGQLLKDFRPDSLNTLLSIQAISPTGSETMRRSIENAKSFYASDDFRRKETEALRAMAASE